MITHTSSQNLLAHGFIGVISDTHGLVRPQVLDALQGALFIIHAGDIGAPEVLEQFQEMASVVAVRGNNDSGSWAQCIPDIHFISSDLGQIVVLHNIQDLDFATLPLDCSLVIAGHSHKPSIQHSHGKTLLNPGSAGPRRFSLPISLARLNISPQGLMPELMSLEA